MRDRVSGGIAGICLLLIATSLMPHGSASAATLVLNDGAVIHGEIRALQDDVYTVETPSLGTLRVRKQDVRSIDHSSETTSESFAESPTGAPPPQQAELTEMQLRMLQSPNLFAMIQSLQSDPEVQAVLTDPEIVSALTSGNYGALMNHPKIIALTQNANVREIIDEVQ